MVQNALNMGNVPSGLVTFNTTSKQFSSTVLTSNGGTLSITNPDGVNGNPLINLAGVGSGFTFTSTGDTVSFSGNNPLTPGGVINIYKPLTVTKWVVLTFAVSVQMQGNYGYTINVPALTTPVLFTLPPNPSPGDFFYIATIYDNTGGWIIQQNATDKTFYYGNATPFTTQGTSGFITGWGGGLVGCYVVQGIFIGVSAGANIWNILSSSAPVTLS